MGEINTKMSAGKEKITKKKKIVEVLSFTIPIELFKLSKVSIKNYTLHKGQKSQYRK